jgi:hypothetical protein
MQCRFERTKREGHFPEACEKNNCAVGLQNDAACGAIDAKEMPLGRDQP